MLRMGIDGKASLGGGRHSTAAHHAEPPKRPPERAARRGAGDVWARRCARSRSPALRPPRVASPRCRGDSRSRWWRHPPAAQPLEQALQLAALDPGAARLVETPAAEHTAFKHALAVFLDEHRLDPPGHVDRDAFQFGGHEGQEVGDAVDVRTLGAHARLAVPDVGSAAQRGDVEVQPGGAVDEPRVDLVLLDGLARVPVAGRRIPAVRVHVEPVTRPVVVEVVAPPLQRRELVVEDAQVDVAVPRQHPPVPRPSDQRAVHQDRTHADRPRGAAERGEQLEQDPRARFGIDVAGVVPRVVVTALARLAEVLGHRGGSAGSDSARVSVPAAVFAGDPGRPR